ncbi:cytoskeletal protein CcmA (bactofilin family) [Sporomusaceae bacterium BoRhaA]|uniref:bactofilin family protein n=1 Tax=Pelorhabdus rhamnosifermentans TaxID=2772457 RepID=UPI001C05F694|nr:polymer-forming cytoskeletal protein [Pelorhabdus rhamnosifermentans]MBU2700174.1 cytoskeletal protein CcmA (bactofilin family) [Pelorhabdus rhamnosifermentans]
MFGKKGSVISGFSDETMETVIGKDTKITGNIEATGTIRIDGQVEGEIMTKGDVIIGETGVVRAKVKAHGATIAGNIYGNIEITEKFEISPTGKMYGDIKTGTLSIGEGAIFKGTCEMNDDENESKTNEKPVILVEAAGNTDYKRIEQ